MKTEWKSHPIQGAGKLPAGVRHSPGESGQLIRRFNSAVPGPAAPGEKGGSAQPNFPDGGRRERRISIFQREEGPLCPGNRAGLTGRTGPARCGGFRCHHKRSDGARCLALSVRAESARPIVFCRDGEEPTDTIPGSTASVTLCPRPRLFWQRATRSSPTRGTAPLLRSSVAGPAFSLPASPFRASLSQMDYKSQHAPG